MAQTVRAIVGSSSREPSYDFLHNGADSVPRKWSKRDFVGSRTTDVEALADGLSSGKARLHLQLLGLGDITAWSTVFHVIQEFALVPNRSSQGTTKSIR